MAAREEMDALLDALVGFARKMLVARSAFHPFGASIASDGRLQMVTADLDDARPTPDTVLAALHARLAGDAAAGRIRAGGTCVDVRLEDGSSDAIRVDIDHAAEEPVRVFLAYAVEAPGRVVFGELLAEPGPPFLYGTPEGRE